MVDRRVRVRSRAVEADVAVSGEGVTRNLVLGIRPDGRFGPRRAQGASTRAWDERRVVVPGLVNAHSHAFQRALRGRAEGGDFWRWRDAMYRLAGAIQPDQLEAVATFAFVEMLLAGITTVGEFHYLHHAPDGSPYDDPDAMAWALVRAAETAGIRLVLLRAAYARGAPGQPSEGAQKRFVDSSPEAAWRAVERLRDKGVLVGLAPHSLRAVPLAWFRELARFGAREGLVVHSHVSEQPQDVESCISEHGKRPIEVLAGIEELAGRFTAVHAIHTTVEERGLMTERGFRTCLCPSTERDLGDGIAAFAAERGLCLGSDSQALIDLFEEARLVDLHDRLRSGMRTALSGEALDRATKNGATALGVPAGWFPLKPGAPVGGGVEAPFADLVVLDLEHPSLAGWRPEDGPAGLAACAAAGSVREVWVSGRAVVQAGRHRGYERARERFVAAVRDVFRLA